MRSFVIFQPRDGGEDLVEYLAEASRSGLQVHFPGAGPGGVETTDPTLHLRGLPDKIRGHLMSGEWEGQVRFYGVGDLELPCDFLLACVELGIGISLWRAVPNTM